MNACNYFSGLHWSVPSDWWTCLKCSLRETRLESHTVRQGRALDTLRLQKKSSTWQHRVCCLESISSSEGATAQTTAMQNGRETMVLLMCKKHGLGSCRRPTAAFVLWVWDWTGLYLAYSQKFWCKRNMDLCFQQIQDAAGFWRLFFAPKQGEFNT